MTQRNRNQHRRARTLVNQAFKRIRIGDYRDCASLRSLVAVALKDQEGLQTQLQELAGDAVAVTIDFVMEGLAAGYFVFVVEQNNVQLRTVE
jgi:hypothetical protein